MSGSCPPLLATSVADRRTCCSASTQNRNRGSTSIAHANLDSSDLLKIFSMGTSLRLHLSRNAHARAQHGAGDGEDEPRPHNQRVLIGRQ